MRQTQKVACALHAAGCVFQADDAGHVCQAQRRFVGQIRDRAPRNVVKDERQIDCFGDFFVVLIEAFLRRLVVVRHHRQACLRTRTLGALSQLDRLDRRIRTGSCNHRYPTRDLFNRRTDQMAMLVKRDRGCFAGGADDHNAVRTFCDVPVHQTAQRIEIERTIVCHGGDNRNQTASDHIYFRHPVFTAVFSIAPFIRRSKTKLGILIHLTGRAAAHAVGLAIDKAELPEVVGSVAGDDTVFLATVSPDVAQRLAARLAAVLEQPRSRRKGSP